jgi:hypothetical protein
MSSNRDYLLYLKHKQEQDPAWKAANHYQNRNQTKIVPPKSTRSDTMVDNSDEIVIDETPQSRE